MTKEYKLNQDKKRYQKPLLRTIELRAEEVLATGCKVDASTSPILPTGPTGCVATACANLGS